MFWNVMMGITRSKVFFCICLVLFVESNCAVEFWWCFGNIARDIEIEVAVPGMHPQPVFERLGVLGISLPSRIYPQVSQVSITSATSWDYTFLEQTVFFHGVRMRTGCLDRWGKEGESCKQEGRTRRNRRRRKKGKQNEEQEVGKGGEKGKEGFKQLFRLEVSRHFWRHIVCSNYTH